MIELEKVSMGYGNDKPVLREVNLTLERGTFQFLSGESGAGKSSLMSILSLMRMPRSGSITMFGQPVSRMPRAALPKIRRRIGMVYQDYKLLEHLTVAENIALPLKISGESRRRIHSKVEELLEWVGLKGTGKLLPDVLSGGQKQRVAIARAVITNPDIILADEPSGNLDRALALRMMHLFTELHKQGTTVLYATHDRELIEQFNYPVVKLVNGSIHHSILDETADLFNKSTLRQAV
jgi:cell division transport system ATP-binding protein